MKLTDAREIFNRVRKANGYTDEDNDGLWDAMPPRSLKAILNMTPEEFEKRIIKTDLIVGDRTRTL